MIKIKGDTSEKKFAHIEKILNRMSRKLHKTVVGVIPPVPVMLSTDGPKPSGEIFTFLVPATGIISDICLCVDKYLGDSKDAVTFEASVVGLKVGSSVKFETRKNVSIHTLDLKVSPGDKLTLRTPTPERVGGIWLSFLYQLGIKGAAQQAFLADEFSRIIDAQDKELEEE